jgi:formyl-CoA transferase
LRRLPGYDALLQAFGGLMSVNGQPDGPPTLIGTAVIDKGTGMWTAIAALGALHRRTMTGKGAVIETSLLDTAVAWGDIRSSMYLATGKVPGRYGNTSPLIVPYDYFETATGPVMIACAGDKLFRILARELGRPDWAEDERFGTNPARVRNKATLLPLIQEILLYEDRDALVARLGAAGVPCAPILDTAEVLAHEQVRASGILQKVPDGTFEVISAPWKVDGIRPPVRRAAPELGEDNAAIFGKPARTADDD